MDESSSRGLLDRARRLVAAGEPAKACRLVEHRCRRDPGDHLLRGWLGVYLAENRDYARAVPLLEESLERRPRFRQAAHALVKIPMRQGDLAAAVRTYEELTTRFPRLAASLHATCQPGPVGAAFKAAVDGNAAPDHDCVVFYHLPFTGGTSWQRALTYVFDGRQRFNIRRRTGLRQLAEYARMPADELQQVRCIHLHHPYPLDPRGRRLLFFTVLREPVARFLSSYHKRLNDARILGTGDWRRGVPGLAASIEHLASVGLADSQARQLAALHPDLGDSFSSGCRPGRLRRRIDAEEDLFYVEATAGLSGDELLGMATDVLDRLFLAPVVLEHMEAGYLSVFAQLGIPVVPRLAHIGVSGRGTTEPDAALRDRIAELHQVDAQIYVTARARFEAQFGPLITALDAQRQSGPRPRSRLSGADRR